MKTITYYPIGTILSPFKQIDDMPIQSAGAEAVRGKVVISAEFIEGLADLEGFSHLYLLYHFHLSNIYQLKVTPFMDDQQRGVFATRAPKRPNAIGLSVVKLIGIDENVLEIENVDVVDGTPLLDIKPFVAEMEGVGQYRIGWLTRHMEKIKNQRSDKRFQ